MGIVFHEISFSYRPGSKNIKPDSLSRQFAPAPDPEDPLLPPDCFVATAILDVEAKVKRALARRPGNEPHNCLFVPPSVRNQVLNWGHSSLLACHR